VHAKSESRSKRAGRTEAFRATLDRRLSVEGLMRPVEGLIERELTITLPN
jgi:hypothetical protein